MRLVSTPHSVDLPCRAASGEQPRAKRQQRGRESARVAASARRRAALHRHSSRSTPVTRRVPSGMAQMASRATSLILAGQLGWLHRQQRRGAFTVLAAGSRATLPVDRCAVGGEQAEKANRGGCRASASRELLPCAPEVRALRGTTIHRKATLDRASVAAICQHPEQGRQHQRLRDQQRRDRTAPAPGRAAAGVSRPY